MSVHALRNGSLGELAKGLFNDLEPAAIRRCPVIRDLYTLLREGGCDGVLTSGSGPSVFGLCRDRAQAEQVASRIRMDGRPEWFIAVTKTETASLTESLHAFDHSGGGA